MVRRFYGVILWGYFMNPSLVFHIIPSTRTTEHYVPEGSIGATQLQPQSAVNYVNKTQRLGCLNTKNCPTDAKKML
jgi:hypothetical protein